MTHSDSKHPAMMEWKQFETRDALVSALTVDIRSVLTAAVATKGAASWAVSGGSTPKPLFAALAAVQTGAGTPQMPWDKVSVALVDERWVDRGHPRSNTDFVHDHLLWGAAKAATFVPMKLDAEFPQECAVAASSLYDPIAPFDSILLGMGADGHTASLFPEAEGLEDAFKSTANCAAVRARRSDVTGDELDRMTLTPHAIWSAPHAVLMITGAEKRAVLRQALEEDTGLPVARIIKGMRTPLHVYWSP